MQIVRIIFWMVTTAVVVALVLMNLQEVEFNFWPLAGGGYIHVRSGVGLIVLLFFLLGLVPMWLLSKAGKWRLTRRINALERSIKAAVSGQPSNIATTTQLEAADPDNPAN